MLITASSYNIQNSNRVAFDHCQSTESSPNKILFIGGLTDGLLTVPYVVPLVDALPASYSLVEVLLSSSYVGWGTSSLSRDVLEIGECVNYFRNLVRGKIVLLGHSTGAQDVMHYIISSGVRPDIDGAILQGGISDREAMLMFMKAQEYEKSVMIAREFIDGGRGEDCLPSNLTGLVFPGPASANRWMSLASPGPDHSGEDDYFSSDFDDDRLGKIFGKAGSTKVPICILFGEKDPYVPLTVNKAALVGKWIECIKKEGGVVDEDSGVIEGATHTLKEAGKPLENLKRRIIGFLGRID